MQLTDAIDLIKNEGIEDSSSVWADLGCGAGTFTYALANLLAPGSIIHAIDSRPVVLTKLANPNAVLIQQQQLDFANEPINLLQLDGILMANSLHYVKDKPLLLNKLRGLLKKNACLLIVEYDTLSANQWVPYPIDFATLKILVAGQGFTGIRKLAERPSLFGRGNIYAALISV